MYSASVSAFIDMDPATALAVTTTVNDTSEVNAGIVMLSSAVTPVGALIPMVRAVLSVLSNFTFIVMGLFSTPMLKSNEDIAASVTDAVLSTMYWIASSYSASVLLVMLVTLEVLPVLWERDIDSI